MLKKAILLLTLMCSMTFPVMAQAWSIGAQATNAGGNIVARSHTPITNANGLVFYSYTTHANVPVTVSANTGYQVSSVKINSIAQPLPIASGTSFQMNIVNGSSQYFT